MRKVLHIGPYKTGTTSIQTYLWHAISAEEPTPPIWYPRPGLAGPGHALMAKEFLQGNQKPLRSVVERAENAGVETLVISAEALSLAYPAGIGALSRIFPDSDLVITLNSVVNRAVSTWQTMVRSGHRLSIANSANQVLRRPEYQPDFLSRFVGEMSPRKLSIVISGQDDANTLLISNICRIIGLPEPDEAGDIRTNIRMGRIEIEVLRVLNEQVTAHASELSEADRNILRQKLISVMHSANWREICPPRPIPTPATMEGPLQRIAEQMVSEIESLQKSHAVDLYGDPRSLLPD